MAPKLIPAQLDTSASDKMVALGRSGRPYAPQMPGTNIGEPPMAPTLAPALLGSDVGAPNYAPRMPGTDIGEPRNPLGGMDARPLSARGGPMGYSPKGVGTNNPNAYAVGQNNKGFRLRTSTEAPNPAPPSMPKFPGSLLSDSARPRLPLRLPGSPASLPSVEGDGGGASQGMPKFPSALREASAPARLPWQLPGSPIQSPPGRDDAFWAEREQSMNDFWKGQDADEVQRVAQEAKAAEAEAKKGFKLQPLDPLDPSRGDALLRGDDSLFNILPGKKPAPPPVTADDVAAARAMGGAVTMPLPGGGQVSFPAQEQAEPAMIKAFNPMSGRVVDYPADYELPEGWTAIQKKAAAATPPPTAVPPPAAAKSGAGAAGAGAAAAKAPPAKLLPSGSGARRV